MGKDLANNQAKRRPRRRPVIKIKIHDSTNDTIDRLPPGGFCAILFRSEFARKGMRIHVGYITFR